MSRKKKTEGEATAAAPGTFEIIPMERLVKGKLNYRKTMDREGLGELTDSIRSKGVLQPILVRPVNGDGKLEVVAGSRRFAGGYRKGRMDGKYWTKAWSLVEGCTPVSEACDNCWLAAMSHRFSHPFGKHDLTSPEGHFSGHIRTRPDRLDIPLRTRKPQVFAIWSDLFHEAVPEDFIDHAYAVMWIAERHIFIPCSKRPKRMAEYWADPETPERICLKANQIKDGNYYFAPECRLENFGNIYHGTTVENQRAADERLPHLLKVPGKRFVSYEPALGPLSFRWAMMNPRPSPTNHLEILKHIHAVVAGGETGRRARPAHPDWFRKVRDHCQAAGVDFFLKSMGSAWERAFGKEAMPEMLERGGALPWR